MTTKKTVISIVFLLIVILLSAAGVCKMNDSRLKDFYDAGEASFAINDIKHGFIPQGIAYDLGENCFFLTGYMTNGENSPIYIYDRTSEKAIKKVLLNDCDGNKFKGHAGGLSVYEDTIYVAGSTDACMYAYPIASLRGASDGASVSAEKKIPLKSEDDYIRVSFTSVDADYLYAGEFHNAPIFYTHKSHKVGAVRQKAYLFGFDLDENNNVRPTCVYSIPDNIQGACFYDGKVYLSRAHGIFPGEIITYSLANIEQNGSRDVLGVSVPMYILSEENADKITTIPPMPEEIVACDGKMYIVFEAAANRYRIGKKMGLDKVYAVPIDYFE